MCENCGVIPASEKVPVSLSVELAPNLEMVVVNFESSRHGKAIAVSWVMDWRAATNFAAEIMIASACMAVYSGASPEELEQVARDMENKQDETKFKFRDQIRAYLARMS